MRYFNVPYFFTEEEKIIGGKLSWREILYIGIGGLIGFLLGYCLPAPLIARIFLGALVLCIGCVFAFFELPNLNMRLDSYLILLFKFHLRGKEFPFRRG